MSDWFATLQRLAPQHGLSRLLGKAAASEQAWLKDAIIRPFANHYGVDLNEAERSNPGEYKSFNDFFTRSLKADARPLADAADALLCPADGVISQAGQIEAGTLLQAKGHRYDIRQLAGALADGLQEGDFFTVYLSPRDYHRVHMPLAGELRATLAVPGALFSVNGSTEASIPGLFCRNERLVCRFETAVGPMLVVLVGAMIVASIETVWDAPQSPYRREQQDQFAAGAVQLDRGAEMGRFLLGSTVICCVPKGAVNLRALAAGDGVRMGESLGSLAGQG